VTPHLKGYVRAYVDRALPPAMLHLYDKHLVCCEVCRAAAEQERRIVAALRSDTGVPMSLRSSLIGLASAVQDEHRPPTSASRAPEVPAPPAGFRMPSAPSYDPVPTVRPTAPALHRSPMRAAVVASIAAGASVAAAWGLAVSPVPGSRVPLVRGPVATFGASPVGEGGLGASALPGSQSATSSRDQRRTTGSVAGNLPYWVVTTRSSTLGAARTLGNPTGTVAPLRVVNVGSTQSGP